MDWFGRFRVAIRSSLSVLVLVSIAGLVACSGSKVKGGTEDTAGSGDASSLLDGGGDDAGMDAGTSDATADTNSSGGDVAAEEDVREVPAPQVWRLSEGKMKWEVFDMGGRPSQRAPAEKILAAFDVEHSNFAFILTKSKVHRLHLHPPEWDVPVPLSDIASDLGSADIKAAYSDPDKSPDDEFSILGVAGGSPKVWSGRYNFSGSSFDDVETSTPEWMSSDAPTVGDVVVAWRDNKNSREWFDGEPPCGNSPDDKFGAYVAYLTSSNVHLHDVWYCPDYFRANQVGMAGISAMGFPGVDKIGAAFWHNRNLYLLARTAP